MTTALATRAETEGTFEMWYYPGDEDDNALEKALHTGPRIGEVVIPAVVIVETALLVMSEMGRQKALRELEECRDELDKSSSSLARARKKARELGARKVKGKYAKP